MLSPSLFYSVFYSQGLEEQLEHSRHYTHDYISWPHRSLRQLTQLCEGTGGLLKDTLFQPFSYLLAEHSLFSLRS